MLADRRGAKFDDHEVWCSMDGKSDQMKGKVEDVIDKAKDALHPK